MRRSAFSVLALAVTFGCASDGDPGTGVPGALLPDHGQGGYAGDAGTLPDGGAAWWNRDTGTQPPQGNPPAGIDTGTATPPTTPTDTTGTLPPTGNDTGPTYPPPMTDTGTQPNPDPGTPYQPPAGTDTGGTSMDTGIPSYPPDPGPVGAPPSIGSPCVTAADCLQTNGSACIPETFSDGTEGWPGGYCTLVDCAQHGCPQGSDCYQISDLTLCLQACTSMQQCGEDYACVEPGACVPGCKPGDCPAGQTCGPNRICEDVPCTPGSCPSGMACDTTNGRCIPDLEGGPGQGPGPVCNDLPPRDCVSSLGYCGQLLQFEPVNGPGYTNYPLNGETWQNQYRSYLRRDVQLLIKHAAAYVDCKATGWAGQHHPIGLGDMSEANGAIPGTSVGQPGHPQGTHQNGFDIDVAYYQVGTTNNYLRAVCPHVSGGAEQYHCLSAPDSLDVWRTALFLGAILTSPRVRVIGVDGKVGPQVHAAMDVLCARGWLQSVSCQKKNRVVFEETNQGYGWYYHHHHHLHLSVSQPTTGTGFAPEPQQKGVMPFKQHFGALERFITRPIPLGLDKPEVVE